jgi:hypothetical protein
MDTNSSTDPIPKSPLGWFKANFTLETVNEISYIVSNSSWTLYKLPEYQPPQKQPLHPEDWNKNAPHLWLNKVKTDNLESILDFVNKWGLLGLWRVKEYREWRPDKSESEFHTGEFGDRISPQYLAEAYLENPDKYKESSASPPLREPLPPVIEAINEFQTFMKHMEEISNAEKAANLLNKYLRDCGPCVFCTDSEDLKTKWIAPSLLNYCYLMVWLDKTNARDYRRCQNRHCNTIFIPKRRDAKFCSNQCQLNAKRLRHYDKYRK